MNLTHQHLTRFKTDGYVVVENALTRDDLGLVISDYEGVVDRLARENAEIAHLPPPKGSMFCLTL